MKYFEAESGKSFILTLIYLCFNTVGPLFTVYLYISHFLYMPK